MVAFNSQLAFEIERAKKKKIILIMVFVCPSLHRPVNKIKFKYFANRKTVVRNTGIMYHVCMYVYIVLKDFFIYGIRVVFLCFWNTHYDGIIKQFVILINFIMQI